MSQGSVTKHVLVAIRNIKPEIRLVFNALADGRHIRIKRNIRNIKDPVQFRGERKSQQFENKFFNQRHIF